MRALWLLVLGISLNHDEPRFTWVDVYIDSADRGLAAYQFEVTTAAKIVGVEGGEVPQFKDAPYYDPAALHGGRIIIAALTVDEAPKGRIRVARLHMYETGKPDYASKLMVAAAPGGDKIEARVEIVRGGKDD